MTCRCSPPNAIFDPEGCPVTACVTPCQFGQSRRAHAQQRRGPPNSTSKKFSDSQPRAEVLPQGAEERHGRAHAPAQAQAQVRAAVPAKRRLVGKHAKKGGGAGGGKGTGVSLAPPEGGPPMGVRHASPGVMGAPPPVSLGGPGGVLGGGYPMATSVGRWDGGGGGGMRGPHPAGPGPMSSMGAMGDGSWGGGMPSGMGGMSDGGFGARAGRRGDAGTPAGGDDAVAA